MSDAPVPELVLHGGAPLHRQIREQIRELIVLGRLHPGEQLPTVRAAAVELAVNPKVVQRAYAQLTRDGLLSTEDGSGTFVAARPPVLRTADGAASELECLCLEFLTRADRYGYAAAEVMQTLQSLSQRRLPT